MRNLGLKEIGLYSRVSLKVSIVDGLNQLFCDLNDLLFSHCGGKNPAIYLSGTGKLPSDTKPSPILREFPVISLTKASLFSVFKALSRKSEPIFLSMPPVVGRANQPPFPEAHFLVMVLWPLSPSPSTTRIQKTLLFLTAEEPHTS